VTSKAFKYRLYPNRTQERMLFWTLIRCRELYNAALQERREAFRMARKSIASYDQANQLPEIKQLCPEYRELHSQDLQDVLRRIDKAMQAFFCRVKAGETPGYPRYHGRNRYTSFTYPQTGFTLDGDRLTLSKRGRLKVKVHRPIEGKVKTCSITYEAGQWYVVFSCEVPISEPLYPSERAVGIDLGITHFAALSDGTFIESPRRYRQGKKKLIAVQQKLSRCKRGAHRRERARKAVARAHRKIRNQRADFHHKVSRQLINQYGTLVFEQLPIANISKSPAPKQDEATGHYLPNGASAKAGLNRSILDAGWGQFQQFCIYKAAWAGRQVVFVNSRNTSQICSGCGIVKKKELDERWHSCACGTELDRDVNAAINIFRLGSSQQSQDWRSPWLEPWGTSL
jgi:putative transposase